MAERKAISKKTRFEIFKRDSFKCQYCGKSSPDVILHIDHIKPVADGGTNHMTNLITACFDCNMGKKDRLLDDNSVMEKQRKQLEELNEKRQQLEMMMKWREALDGLESEKLKIIGDKWSSKTNDTYSLNDNGYKTIKKLLKKYDFNAILDSIDEAANQYLKQDGSGKFKEEEVEKAWKMVGKICSVKQLEKEKPYMKQLFYIRGILKNRLRYCNEWKSLQLLEKAHVLGASIENLTDFAKEVTNWTNFEDELERFIKKQSNDEEEDE